MSKTIFLCCCTVIVDLKGSKTILSNFLSRMYPCRFKLSRICRYSLAISLFWHLLNSLSAFSICKINEEICNEFWFFNKRWKELTVSLENASILGVLLSSKITIVDRNICSANLYLCICRAASRRIFWIASWFFCMIDLIICSAIFGAFWLMAKAAKNIKWSWVMCASRYCSFSFDAYTNDSGVFWVSMKKSNCKTFSLQKQRYLGPTCW